MAQRSAMSEYRAGMASGRLHTDMDGCMDNRAKAERGQHSDRPLIAAYWRGYIQGMKAATLPERVTLICPKCNKTHPGWCY